MNYELRPIYTMWPAQTLALSIILKGMDLIPVPVLF